MTNERSTSHWKAWTGIILVGMVGLVAGIAFSTLGCSAPAAHTNDLGPKTKGIPVTFTHAKKGVLERLSTQPGSIEAYESVQLFAKVAGFLKTQNVDIGDRVKKEQILAPPFLGASTAGLVGSPLANGPFLAASPLIAGRAQILAVVDVPELETQVQRNRAAVDQAKAHVTQMKARVTCAKADLDAAIAAVTQSQAAAKSAAAWVRYRSKQLKRMEELLVLKSIDERLVDENKERYEASIETELSAKEAITTSKARVKSCEAKIDQAEADVVEADSEVRVAKAELARIEVQLAFATITSPFDGVVTERNFFPQDFVRSANEGSAHKPLLVVQRTDLMRVVVHVPARDAPYAHPGKSAIVEIDELPGKKLDAKISRTGNSLDTQTRTMRVELDLPNPTGKICHGMYGKVTIVLDRSTDKLSIPSSCLVGKAHDGVGTVYVIQDHHAHLREVRLGIDNGLRVAVLDGIKVEDEVIVQPGNALAEDIAVTPSASDEEASKADTDH